MEPLIAGILAHVDAGKTTLSEAMLYEAGCLRRLGRVDHQDAFLDTDAIERERGITIFSKQAVLPLPTRQLTLLDTPGHVDFSAETERTLQVLDCAVLVISGSDGVQGHTLTLWQLLKRYGVELEGKNAAVVGRSLVIGRPVAMLLQAANATVTICHSRTRNLAEVTRRADIVVAAMGRAEFLTAEYFSPGQVVVDVGINYSEAKGRLVGDVDFDSVAPIVRAISPVPAGVGMVTSAILARHTVKAAGGAL